MKEHQQKEQFIEQFYDKEEYTNSIVVSLTGTSS